MSILTHTLWRMVAWLATRPRITAWLIQRAMRTPYTHITSADGQHVYMGRWWLFNPYGRGEDGEQAPARWPWLPSVRIHHICRADQDRDLHDHPWNARTIILRGCYLEQRLATHVPRSHLRKTGYTGRLLYGQYHRISEVSEGGVWTLFITGRYRGTWGFLVDGKKVPWRTYLGLEKTTRLRIEPDQEETHILVKRRHILALSRALGHPKVVNASEGDTVEDCLVEMAAQAIAQHQRA